MADDRLAAELAAIRERAEQITREHGPDDCDMDGATCTGHDAERLLAAVEAVLELHQPGAVMILGALCRKHESHRYFSITSTEAAGITDCPDCPATVSRSCTGCGPHARLDSCRARASITAALTGKEQADGD